MSLTKTQAFFQEFPFLRILEKHVPADVTVKVRRVEGDFIDMKVPGVFGTIQGHILMFDEDGSLLYSVARTNRRFKPVGFASGAWLPALHLLLIALLVALSFFVWGRVDIRAPLACCMVGLYLSFVRIGHFNSRWESCHNQTINHALKMLGDRSKLVHYVAVHNGATEPAAELVLYKTPKGYSLGDWVALQHLLAQREIQEFVDQIDADGSRQVLLARTLLAKRTSRTEDGKCTVCGKRSETGNFCSHCGATFLDPKEI